MIRTVRMFGAFPLGFSSGVFLYFSSEPLVARAAAGCRYKVPFTTELVFYAARYFYRFAKCRPGQKPKGVEPPYRRVYMCTVRCVSCAYVCVCVLFFSILHPFRKSRLLLAKVRKPPCKPPPPFEPPFWTIKPGAANMFEVRTRCQVFLCRGFLLFFWPPSGERYTQRSHVRKWDGANERKGEG